MGGAARASPGANISGLGTLVSGAYIGVDVGHSAVPQHHFVGLEVPPIVTSGLPGREYSCMPQHRLAEHRLRRLLPPHGRRPGGGIRARSRGR